MVYVQLCNPFSTNNVIVFDSAVEIYMLESDTEAATKFPYHLYVELALEAGGVLFQKKR